MANKAWAWAGLALSVPLLLLSACSTPEKAKAAAAKQSVIQGPGKSEIRVSGVDTGSSIVLAPAQQLEVRLQLMPTAGVEWSLVGFKPGVLSVLDSKYERPVRDADVEDVMGVRVWRFKTDAPGSVALTFELRRPRVVAAPMQTVTYAVTVK